MAAGVLDLSLEQGSTFLRKMTITDTNTDPVDLTGDTFRGKVKKYVGGSVVATFTCVILDQITNTGEVTFGLSAAETAALPTTEGNDANRTSSEFIYDIERVLASGAVERVLQGKITLSHEVTI